MVNRFTQENGSLIIPRAAIFSAGNPVESISHSGRAQLNYSRSFGKDHVVSALAGGEIRQLVQNTRPGYRLYNYDRDLLTGTGYYDYMVRYKVRPSGSTRIPAPPANRRRFTDRYLSYFGNASYAYRKRYVLSASVRWDGSNLFGVKANQKGTPLWSVGGSWTPSSENFYDMGWLPHLRLRATYGSSGNVNKLVSVYPTVAYTTDFLSGLQTARIISAGNPSLRWEQVNTLNLALDFATKSHRISGSLDYYIKDAEDLIGADFLAPSTGIITNGSASNSNLINYANLRTRGIDLQLKTRNLIGAVQWNTMLLFNYVRNEVTHFNTAETNQVHHYTGAVGRVPAEGDSRDAVYAFPWYGLDGQTGFPIVHVNGGASDDYRSYYQVENLNVVGLSVPPCYGSIRNELAWKGVSVSILLSWKQGYVFRKDSSLPRAEYIAPSNYHMDYLRRWQAPGDEQHTNVPAQHLGPDADGYMGSYYQYAEVLVAQGDHIRLQDVNLSYSLPPGWMRKTPFQQVSLYTYARNLGVLWRANRDGIDPDYPTAEYPAPRTVAFGIRVDF